MDSESHLSPWAACLLALSLTGCAQHGDMQLKAPVAPPEWSLPSQQATPWVSQGPKVGVLEGASFDRAGNLLFCDVSGGHLLRANAQGEISVLASFGHGHPGGTAVHRDGRVFVAVIADQYQRGWITAVGSEGAQQIIIGPEQGYVPNDLVFDASGGFYFTDFRGNVADPTGGVYYVAAGSHTPVAVLPHLALANGVALSPDGHTLWVTEYGKNLLHKLTLQGPAQLAPLGSAVPYRFSGGGPDSMRTDSQGNLYVALMEQGRVMILAPNGVPVGQVLMPGRDEGQYLKTASLALAPDSRSMVVVAGNDQPGKGGALFRATAAANGLVLYSHQ